MTTNIHFPYNIDFYYHQKQFWNALFYEKKKHILLVWHRRAGKTEASINANVAMAQLVVGLYIIVFPKINQAKIAVWDAVEGGKRFLDHIPSHLIKHVNNQEMKVTLKNNSIIRLMGSDGGAFERATGAGAYMVTFDEYAKQNPSARDYILPMIQKNGGIEIIISTPRGQNHFYDLFKIAQANPEIWHSQYKSIDQTKDNNGNQLFPIENIENIGWDENKIQQELYLSWTASSSGAYFSKQLKNAREDGRVYEFPIDPKMRTYTFWDIGYRDSTAIWVAQMHMGEVRLVGYYENAFEDLPHYVEWVNTFASKNGIIYKAHYCPHDAAQMRVHSKNFVEIARGLGIRFEAPVQRIPKKALAIEMAKAMFPICKFKIPNVQRGLDCLLEYHAKYNEAMAVYQDTPEHNWASDGADAFLLIAQVVDKLKNERGSNSQIIPDLVFKEMYN